MQSLKHLNFSLDIDTSAQFYLEKQYLKKNAYRLLWKNYFAYIFLSLIFFILLFPWQSLDENIVPFFPETFFNGTPTGKSFISFVEIEENIELAELRSLQLEGEAMINEYILITS